MLLRHLARIVTDKSYCCTRFNLLHRAGRVLNASPLENIVAIGRQSKEMDFCLFYFEQGLSFCFDPAKIQSGMSIWRNLDFKGERRPRSIALICESDRGSKGNALTFFIDGQIFLFHIPPCQPTNQPLRSDTLRLFIKKKKIKEEIFLNDDYVI